ncbi:hypothetical protein YC2023_014932 [Brassica napus]
MEATGRESGRGWPISHGRSGRYSISGPKDIETRGEYDLIGCYTRQGELFLCGPYSYRTRARRSEAFYSVQSNTSQMPLSLVILT